MDSQHIFVGNLPISQWPTPAITAPYRIDVRHRGRYKMAGMIIRMHPGPDGREWAFYHAHSGTQSTRNYADAWGIGIDQCVINELVWEKIRHIYVHDKHKMRLYYIPTDEFLLLSDLRITDGRARLFVLDGYWRQVSPTRVPEPIPWITKDRWKRIDPAPISTKSQDT